MNKFDTKIIIPDPQDLISGSFKLVAPVAFFVLCAACVRSYYAMNGYPPPVLFGTPFYILLTIVLPILFLYLWYHKNYTEKGTLALDKDTITVGWNEPHKDFVFNINEIEDLRVIYDGYSDFFGPNKGTENKIMFTHNHKVYNFNFLLANEEAASDMAKVLQTWYAKGIKITETNTKGEDRYLMLYSPSSKTKANLA